MSTAKRLTLIGATMYRKTLFDSLALPDGYDKTIFIDSLLLEHGEKSVLYTDLDFLEYSIGAWSRKWSEELKRIYMTLTEAYDPLHNYNRYEEYKDKETGEKSGTDKTNSSGTNSSTRTPDLTTEQKTAAFNSGDYQPTAQTTETGTEKTDGKFGQEEAGEFSEKNGRTLEHTAHLYGNIGTTKSQEMATDEINLRTNGNLYTIATSLFATELLINVF